MTEPDSTPAVAAPLTPRRLYGIVAVAETITWTLLILGMIGKYGLELGDWPVRVFGLLHGVVFISYALSAGLVGVNQFWPTRRIAAAVATAVIPYATIPFDRWLLRRDLLGGDWRRQATEDPRDHTRLSALLRLFLRHPLWLSLGMIVAVFAIVSVLLWLGPPTQWADRF